MRKKKQFSDDYEKDDSNEENFSPNTTPKVRKVDHIEPMKNKEQKRKENKKGKEQKKKDSEQKRKEKEEKEKQKDEREKEKQERDRKKQEKEDLLKRKEEMFLLWFQIHCLCRKGYHQKQLNY